MRCMPYNIAALGGEFFNVVKSMMKTEFVEHPRKALVDKLSRSDISQDSKNALLLHLLPALIKPTGRPQQSNFLAYTSDVASVRKEQTPYILVVTEDVADDQKVDTIKQITVFVDGPNTFSE
ncbi:hypothetical protein ACFFRR_009657 [Megaselia abdita]